MKWYSKKDIDETMNLKTPITDGHILEPICRDTIGKQYYYWNVFRTAIYGPFQTKAEADKSLSKYYSKQYGGI